MSFVRPTPRGRIVILVSIGMTAVALVNVNLTICFAAACADAILVASLIMSFFSLFHLDLKRIPAKDGVSGERMTLPVKIINRGRSWRQALIIREHIPFAENERFNVAAAPLAGGEERLINRTLLAAKRGFYSLGKITLIGGDPAGLFCRHKNFDLPGEIVIYPGSVKLSYMPIRIKRHILASAMGRPVGVSGQGQEFFGVREYRPSDEVRFIHWKSSVKHHKLLVKEFEANSATMINIFLDTEEKVTGNGTVNNNLEYLIKTAASMVNYLAGMYCQMFFVTSRDGSDIWATSGEAFGLKEKIMDSLAMLKPGNLSIEELFRREVDFIRPNSIFYCLTMKESPELRKFFDLLVDRGVDVRWIYAPGKYFPATDFVPAHEKVADKREFAQQYGVSQFIARKDLSISGMLTYG